MKNFEKFEHHHPGSKFGHCKRNKEAGRFMFGLFVLLGGLALLLRSMGIYREFIDTYIFEWQIVLVLIGLSSLVSHSNKGPGIMFLTFGAVLYLRDYFDFSTYIVFWQVIVAIVLLLLGFTVLFMRSSPGKQTNDEDTDDLNPDIIEDIAILGGSERSMITDNFRGGKIVAFLGGSGFNLKGCNLAPGKNNLNVICIFGGFKMVIPENWNVQIKTTSIFGGISDKNQRIIEDPNVIHANVLIIKGLLLFGGGEIKR